MRQLKIQKSITNRNSEALDKYLVEIGRAPMVSIDEEIELAQAIRKGGWKNNTPVRRRHYDTGCQLYEPLGVDSFM